MKLLNKYLVVTSVIFHIAILTSLYWIIPHYEKVLEGFETGVNSSNYENNAIIRDISEISQNGLKYKGYLVEIDGQDLYIPSAGADSFIVGEEVKIMTMINSFNDLNTLNAFVVKK
jgi:hypothetical protein